MMKQLSTILKPISMVSAIQSIAILICCVIAYTLGEYLAVRGFLITAIISGIIAIISFLLSKSSQGDYQQSIRTGFLLVSLIWITVCFLGALPYYFSGSIPTFDDALFESVSGFTTTGASILKDIEALPSSILFWRSLTHWLGGGGIIVLAVAILPIVGVGSMKMMKAETAGVKGDKLTPRIGDTAKYLWFLYVGLTLVGIVLYMIGGMNILDAFTHSSSSISTSGLSTKNASVGAFKSDYIDWVTIVLMFLGGMNFILIIRFITGKFHYLKVDTEFKVYLGIVLIVSSIIFVINYNSESYQQFAHSTLDTFRYAMFHVVSIITTTGFATENYELWPAFSQSLLFILMFIGASSGSTTGGIKIMRHIILSKQAVHEIKYLLHPSGVFMLRLNGNPIKNNITHAATGIFVLYMLSILFLTVIVSSANVDLSTAVSTAVAIICNVGPGFGEIGPTDNYAFYPPYIKYTLSFFMLLGRLEFYTLIIIFTTWFWKR